MKPTKMRNMLIYKASNQTRSKQLSGMLSEELRKKYGKRSIRAIKGDTVKILRGEFKGVDGKVSSVNILKNSIAIEGVKKEKTKGDKFDVHIHVSNVVITALNTDDSKRVAKLESKPKPKGTKGTGKSKEKEE